MKAKVCGAKAKAGLGFCWLFAPAQQSLPLVKTRAPLPGRGARAHVLEIDNVKTAAARRGGPVSLSRTYSEHSQAYIEAMTDPLDLRGLQCPLVVLRIRRAMAAVPPGGTLTALADDPMALLDVPVMCHHMKFALREAAQDGGLIRFRIEKPPGWTKPSGRGPMK